MDSNYATYPDSVGHCYSNPELLPAQRWIPSSARPYPMNFVQAQSSQHQIRVVYRDHVLDQGLSINQGPVMYPVRQSHNRGPVNGYERKNCIMYPTTHSIPGPYLQSYINLPNRMYMY